MMLFLCVSSILCYFLFDICQNQNCTTAELVAADFRLPLRRRLVDNLLVQWNSIVDIVRQPRLNSTPDQVVWGLNKKKVFTTKSVYLWLERNLAGANNKLIWQAPIPLKIKIFMWKLFS